MRSRSGTTLSAERPFPGLRPFEFADREYFFGRRKHVLDIYGLLDLSRFIAVIGSSGSGKSSLVRAGLLPLLEGEKTWRTVTIHPGDHPMTELTDGLAELAERVEGDDDETHRSIRRRRVELALKRSSFGLSAALDEMPSLGDASVLVVVDQFEELFRYTGTVGAASEKRVADTLWRDEAAFFVQSLLEATRMAERPIYVLITMRSDFIGDCARFNGLPEAVSAAQFLVPSLTRDQREEVIREPINKAGATIEPELVERLLIDIGPELDQLPVLSHCLARLWSRAKDHHLTLVDYENVGGITGALSKHANEVLASKPLAGLGGGVELVFRALSERDKEGRATRRALLFERLLAETGCTREELVKILDRFRAEDCSFIIPSTSAVPTLRNDTRIDVVHEALLRRWDKISAEDRGWLAKEEADGRFYRGLLAMLEGAAASTKVTLPLDQVEERWQRWQSRPRTAAWAQRYGGHFERVEQLLNDSRTALEQAREAERKRIESEEAQKREKLALETKLAQEQANAAKLLAQRTRMLAAVMSVIAILAVAAAVAAVGFGAKSAAAEAKANREAAAATAAYNVARSEKNSLLAEQVQLRRSEHEAVIAANEAREQAVIAMNETAIARGAETRASSIATRESNMEQSLALVGIDHGMYQTTGYDNRIAGLIGTDAYVVNKSGGARDMLLTAAWTPDAIARVALPEWSLGGIADRGRYIAVLAGQRQRRYGEPVRGSLLTVDAASLAVLGRTPGVSGSLMCGFDDSSRVALAGSSGVTLYDVAAARNPQYAGSIHSGPVRAMACLPQGRIAYVDESGRLRIASEHESASIGRVSGDADGIAVSSSGRLAAVTTAAGDVAVYDLAARRLLSQDRRFTESDDCSAVVGCAGAVAFTQDDKQIGWYDAGAMHVAPITASVDDSYACPKTLCSTASLIYFAPGSTIPSVVGSGGALYYDTQSKTYASSYNDEAGSQRRPILDAEFGMYVTPYDPSVAQQPNPFRSGLAEQSFSRIDGPLLGTIPAQQWPGSYGLRGHELLIPGQTGYLSFDLTHLRTNFEQTYNISYHVRMFDCGDGEHAVAFNMFTGDVQVMDLRSATPTVLHHFRVPKVPVKNGSYEYFVEPAYDPQTGIVTTLSYSTGSAGFATLRRFTANGNLLSVENRAQLLRRVRIAPSTITSWNLTARGNYIVIKVNPGSDAIIRADGATVGSAFSIDYVSPNERLSIATRRVSSAYREAAFSLPSWRQNAFLVIPWTAQRLAISPNGTTMAYYEEGNDSTYTLHLYDLATRETYQVVLPNPPDLSAFSDLSFSADGRYLLASYSSGTYQRLATYAVDPNAWARSACLMAGRSLSQDEFRQYVGAGIRYRDGCIPYINQMYRW